jgi:hypothetical protein
MEQEESKMTITAATLTAPEGSLVRETGARSLEPDERGALALQVENGSATLRPLSTNWLPYTHRLTASDGWSYLVAIAHAD